jgi:hypothetical protein
MGMDINQEKVYVWIVTSSLAIRINTGLKEGVLIATINFYGEQTQRDGNMLENITKKTTVPKWSIS